MTRLFERYWPSDPEDRVLVIQAVFSVLETEKIPSLPVLENGDCVASRRHLPIDVQRPLDRIFISLKLLSLSLGGLSAGRKPYAEIVRDHYPCLLGWLRVLFHSVPWVYDEDTGITGPDIASGSLHAVWMLTDNLPDLLPTITRIETVELVLDMFVWTSSEGATLATLYDMGCPATVMLHYLCSTSRLALNLTHDAIRQSSRSRQHLIVKRAKQRLDEWENACVGTHPEQRQQFISMVLLVVNVIRHLMTVPSFAKVALKERFISRALSQSQNFPDDIVPPDTEGPRVTTPFPMALLIKFFPRDSILWPPRRATPVIAELVQAGLVERLAGHLLSWNRKDNEPHPWLPWGDKPRVANPLVRLSFMAQHLLVSEQIQDALTRLSESQHKLLDNGPNRDHWVGFRLSVDLYSFVGQHQRKLRSSGRSIILCDNLNVSDIMSKTLAVTHRRLEAPHKAYPADRRCDG